MKLFTSSFAGEPKHRAHYSIHRTETSLKAVFRVEAPPVSHPDSVPGEFFEGLWYYDCGELWVASSESTRYIEFNLAPNGAWWSFPFLEARVRATGVTPPQVVTMSNCNDRSWEASIEVSWNEIHRCLGDTSEPNCNLTLVLGGCPDIDTPLENLHTVAHLREVDFHRPQDWIPLSNF